MMYNIELNVADIKVSMLHRIELVVKKHGCENLYNGWDHLVILNPDKDLKKFNKVIDDIEYVCSIYGVRYDSLLV